MLQSLVIDSIHNERRGMVETTLEAMRDRYNDMLADFHCLDKDIYSLELNCESLLMLILSCSFFFLL
jgi:hypothetical protein